MKKEIKNAYKQIWESIDVSVKKVIYSIDNKKSKIYKSVFNETIEKYDSSNFSGVSDGKAIYIFVMKHDFAVKNTFDDAQYSSKLKDKNTSTLPNGSVIYVGKSHDIHSRSINHFSGKPKDTYSLKMNAPERMDNSSGIKLADCVEMVVFRLRKQYSSDKRYYETLLPSIEDQLHEHYQPLIGSPRK